MTYNNMREELLKIIKNPNDKVIAVDLDGTLCHGEFWGDDEPTPIKERIDFLWELYKKGGHIIIYTARAPRYFEATNAWLIKHDVPFHGIAMQKKIGADVYIDDKALNIDDVFTSFVLGSI